jgi:uncharacterized protein YndB with AHSA1/START domain
MARPAPPHATLRLVRHYEASAGQVFDAWLEPGLVARWLFAHASQPLRSVALHPRVGGAFRLVDRAGGVHAGVYREIARPARLALALSVGAGAPCSHVRVELTPTLAGCRLALTHGGLTAATLHRFETRWAGSLYGLGLTLDCAMFDPEETGGDPQCNTC